MIRGLFLFLLMGLLTGCVGSNTQAQSPLPAVETASESNDQEPVAEISDQSERRVEQVVIERETSNISNQIDQLMGRLTLVQEQVIRQQTLSQKQMELSQAILQRVQLITETALIDESKPQTQESVQQAQQLDAALNQLLQVANEMQLNGSGTESGNLWGVASTVTAKGWVLIRYQKNSGQSWIAEKGNWTPLTDQSSPAAGDYLIQIERRDTDSKGYVAVRLDQKSGDTWWLNDRTWQAY